MVRISLGHLAFATGVAAILGSASGCGNPFGENANLPNAIDTVTLYALRNTGIREPSAFDLLSRNTARSDTTANFDFAFDIDSTGTALIYPAGVLGLSPEPGVQLSDKAFDDISSAPDRDYITDQPIPITNGTVFIARSRSTLAYCVYVYAATPRYGKFHVLELDPTARRLILESLVDLNCGYRGLQPGVPGS